MIDVHYCPRCELRFTTTAELADHFERDHGADHEVFERFHYGHRTRSEPVPLTLVVANQTLAEPGLRWAILDHSRAGKAVLVVVPVLERGIRASAAGAAIDVEAARARLDSSLDALAAQGCQVEGRLGDVDPFRAISEVFAEGPVEEVLIGTLDVGVSRWLRADLPTRVERRFGVPVHTFTAGSVATRPAPA